MIFVLKYMKKLLNDRDTKKTLYVPSSILHILDNLLANINVEIIFVLKYMKKLIKLKCVEINRV
jgi:hypothetical protein